MKALLLENIHTDAVEILENRGFDVDLRTGALDEDELIAALDGVTALGIRSKTQVTRRVLEARPDLEAIGAFCIGTNQIDLKAAAELGIAAFNAPFSNTRSVVELAIGEIIAMARHLTDKSFALHQGRWDKSAKGSHEVRGRTLGIVGYGNIGSQLSVVAESLGMRVLFYDVVDRLALGNAHRCSTLEELLGAAETVSLHVDGRPGNAGFFGAEQFAKMRPRSLFLNLARGFVVDYEALRDNLLSRHLAGAAVDVFPEEPKANGEPFTSVLQGLPNVILTPHIGGSTQEAQQDIGFFVASKLVDFHESGASVMSVNMPQVLVEQVNGGVRLLHLHHNVPGVLARMNQAIAEHEVNIDRQTLATRGELGYVITEVSGARVSDLAEKLRLLPETVRLREVSRRR